MSYKLDQLIVQELDTISLERPSYKYLSLYVKWLKRPVDVEIGICNYGSWTSATVTRKVRAGDYPWYEEKMGKRI